MDLLIEQGILLKPYALNWMPNGWPTPPAGWTPARGPWVQRYAGGLQAEAPELTRAFALRQAEQEQGKRLLAARKPWPGWIPIIASRDKDISKAYRRLFVAMNEHLDEQSAAAAAARAGASFPPDGRYVLQGGKMEATQ